MANKIQIKRSTTNAAPTGLANGELAYTANGEILFLGHPDGSTGSIAIGGRRVPGTLTANQALVANSSSAINEVRAGQVNAITTSAVGANVIANTSAYFVGNTTVNTFITQNLLDLGGQINANGGVGSAGQVLKSGGAGNTYWAADTDTNTTYDLVTIANTAQGSLRLADSSSSNDNISFVGANGVSVTSDGSGTVTITGQIDTNTTYDLLTVANTTVGVVTLDPSTGANDDIKFIGAGGITVTSDGSGNVTITQVDTNTTYDLLTVSNNTVGVLRLDPSTGSDDDARFIGANGIIVTSDGSGNVTISTTSGGNGTFNNLIVSGNLTVSGTFTQFDVETLTVEDPLIELSRTQANTGSFVDAVDIGFYGQFGNTANVVYTGLFRDASATDKTFRLFSGQIPAPTTTVDTANVNFGYANLIIHSLNGGNTNSTIDLFTIDGGTF